MIIELFSRKPIDLQQNRIFSPLFTVYCVAVPFSMLGRGRKEIEADAKLNKRLTVGVATDEGEVSVHIMTSQKA